MNDKNTMRDIKLRELLKIMSKDVTTSNREKTKKHYLI